MKTPRILQERRRVLFVRLISNGLAQAGAAIGTAWLVQLAFDDLLMARHSASAVMVIWIGMGLVVSAGVIAWLRMMERIDAERMGQDYAADVRMVLYDHLNSLTPRALHKRSQGGVALRFVGDMTALRRWVSLGLARLTVASVMMVTALTILAIINWPLGLAITAVLVCGGAAALSLGGRLRAAARESRRRLSHLAANVNEKIATIAVVQIFGQSARERARILRQGQRLQTSMVTRARAVGQILAVTEATAALATAACLLIGIYEVSTGHASAGQVVAAMTIVGILMPPLRDLGRVLEYWHGAHVAREKLQEFLTAPTPVTERPGAPALCRGTGRLEFEAVSVSGAVHGISATVEPGSMVALTGPNGAGKSTLLSLAARLIDPDQGIVRLDGQDLACHSLASLRRAVGMASPDLPLLRGTVEKNLLYRWPDAPEEEIGRVWELCGIGEVLAGLADGAQTRIAEGGAGLSAGQRQRIALARALLGNPPLLLLDEVDTNLDPKAGAVVKRVLEEYRGTVLLISHRLDHLHRVNEVWYVQEGRLLEVGPAVQVLSGTGAAARFFRGNLATAS